MYIVCQEAASMSGVALGSGPLNFLKYGRSHQQACLQPTVCNVVERWDGRWRFLCFTVWPCHTHTDATVNRRRTTVCSRGRWLNGSIYTRTTQPGRQAARHITGVQPADRPAWLHVHLDGRQSIGALFNRLLFNVHLTTHDAMPYTTTQKHRHTDAASSVDRQLNRHPSCCTRTSYFNPSRIINNYICPYSIAYAAACAWLHN